MEEEKKVETPVEPIEEVKPEVEEKENPVLEGEVVDAPKEEAALFTPASEEEEEEFVDDVSKKQVEERTAKAEEEKAKEEEQQKAAEEAEKGNPLRIPPELEGGNTQLYILPGEKGRFEYDDARLASVEEARKQWVKSYRIGSIIKISVSMVFLAGIILGWIIPARLMGSEAGQIPLYIALGTAGAALLAMLLTSFLVKRQQKGVVATYFKNYYKGFNDYVMDDPDIDHVEGDVDCKITKEEFEAGKVFENSYSVGSRNSLTFTYKGNECALAAAAGQEERGKRIATSFVGKFLRMHNNLNMGEDGVVIYLKGNDRAIPPTSLLNRQPAVEEPTLNVYGRDKYIALIPDEAMEKIRAIQTDKLLVDVTISIQTGRTYIYMGYEDTLMVLPNREPFNPNYTIAFKHQLMRFLEIGDILNKR